jgi:hypothetical protein
MEHIAFTFSVVACLVAASASWSRGRRCVAAGHEHTTSEPAAGPDEAEAEAATVSLAGPLSVPEPSTAAPRSLTTTEAPSLADPPARPRHDGHPAVQSRHSSSPAPSPAAIAGIITGIYFWN